MNIIIKEIREILKAYAVEYQAGMKQVELNIERFNPVVAKPENEKIQTSLDASAKKGKDEIEKLCAKGLETSLAKDHLYGSDITADNRLLAEGIVNADAFGELVERYRGTNYNYTMLTVLREYARLNELSFPSSIPTRTDKIDGWKKIENGAVSTLGEIQRSGLDNNHRVMLLAEDFMANPVSDLLNEVIGN